MKETQTHAWHQTWATASTMAIEDSDSLLLLR